MSGGPKVDRQRLDTAPPLTYTVSEAARLLGVSVYLIYNAIKRGELACVKIGRRKLIPAEVLELHIERAIAEAGGRDE